MSLKNKFVVLYAVNLVKPVSSLCSTIGELVAACHSKNCPMGFFSCPILRSIDCSEVTIKHWANVFGVKEEDDDRAD